MDKHCVSWQECVAKEYKKHLEERRAKAVEPLDMSDLAMKLKADCNSCDDFVQREKVESA